MKTLKFFEMTLLMVMLTFNFTSCSSDDSTMNEALLIGKWQQTWEKVINSDGTIDYDCNADELYTTSPNIANIGADHIFDNDKNSTWTFDGKILKVTQWSPEDTTYDDYDWTVIKLTDDTLIMSIEDWNDNDNNDGTKYLNYTMIKTFKKVNE